MSVLEVKDLKKKFDKTEVLKGISFTLEKGQVLSVIGSSGSGKTTLLRCINSLETADEGSITVDGSVIFDGSGRTVLTKEQKRINQLNVGLVFQQFNLFPQYSVLRNVTLAMEMQAKKKPDFKQNKKAVLAEIDRKARMYIEKVNLTDRINAYPCELSGGQQQRVAIARAIVNRPQVILADEPTGSLDSDTAEMIFQIFLSLNKQGKTVIIATHDDALAKRCDRIIRIHDGLLVQ